MQIKVIFCISLLVVSFFSFISNATPSRHLYELKLRFPYGILTDDYGTLTKNDLAINACLATPIPITPKSHSYSYWQCFESKRVSFDCESNGVPDEHEGIMALVVVKAATDRILHEYIERRFWPIKDCKRFIKDAAGVLKGTRYACISGSFISKDVYVPEKESMSWTFERIKTQRGCEGRDCDFTKEFKRTHCPNLKL